MRHIKKFNESKGLLIKYSDEELEDRLEYLRLEHELIQSNIQDVVSILRSRQNDRDQEYIRTLPKSIFDFNKEQLDWIFEHNHSTSTERYNISNNYFNELVGVNTTGFNKNTNQFYFSIVSSRSMNDNEDSYEYKPNIVKTIEFLAKNLKKVGGYVEFGVLYSYSSDYGDKVLVSDTDIKYGGYTKRKMKSIEQTLEYIVDDDISSI